MWQQRGSPALTWINALAFSRAAAEGRERHPTASHEGLLIGATLFSRIESTGAAGRRVRIEGFAADTSAWFAHSPRRDGP